MKQEQVAIIKEYSENHKGAFENKKKSDSRKQNSQNDEELSQRSSPWRAQKIYSWKICEKNKRNLN